MKFREAGGRLASYILEVSSEEGVAVVSREILRYRRGRGSGRPWHFVDFSGGRGTAITNESVYGEEGAVEEREEFELDDPSVLAIKGLGQFREFRVVSEFRGLIENWHISNFHIADARPSAEEGYAEHVSTRGDNIAQVAQFLYQRHREQFDRVLEAMRSRVPGVVNVEARSTEDGRLVLRFQDGSFTDPFIARHVSDGTINSWNSAKERGGMTCSFESYAENSRRGTSVSRRRSSAHSHMRANACSVNCAGGDFGIRTRWSILAQPWSNSSRISKTGGARDTWRSFCRETIVRAAFRSSLKGSKAWSGHTDRPSRTEEVFGAHQASTGSHVWPPAGCRRLVARTS